MASRVAVRVFADGTADIPEILERIVLLDWVANFASVTALFRIPAVGSPVAFVRTSADGVPRDGVVIEQFVVRQIDPDPDTAFAIADNTPVPAPISPVDIGNPVPFVNVTELGVPRLGVTSVGLVANTRAPDPVSFVIAAAKLADVGVARNVDTPVPSPVMPDSGATVAVIVPLPVAARDAPVPMIIAAVVLVPLIISLKALLPPDPEGARRNL